MRSVYKKQLSIKYFKINQFAIEVNSVEEVSFVDKIFKLNHSYLGENTLRSGHCISVLRSSHSDREYYENEMGRPVMKFKEFKKRIEIK